LKFKHFRPHAVFRIRAVLLSDSPQLSATSRRLLPSSRRRRT
jgi:hypothetical protein